jgi:hypothetical protein
VGDRLTSDHDIPARQPSKEPTDGTQPVNAAERHLRELLLAAGFEEGVRGEQIKLDAAIGTTTPDVIYRAPHHDDDEGVCSYLDGLSGHLHADPATAEKDRRIRDWLRGHGYEVIEIAASDLDDVGAMTRHFRRLAGYLGEKALRDAVRDDTGWFERAAGVVRAVVARTLRVVTPVPEDRYRTCVTLSPLNPEYEPIVVAVDEEADVRVVAEVVEVLAGDVE